MTTRPRIASTLLPMVFALGTISTPVFAQSAPPQVPAAPSFPPTAPSAAPAPQAPTGTPSTKPKAGSQKPAASPSKAPPPATVDPNPLAIPPDPKGASPAVPDPNPMAIAPEAKNEYSNPTAPPPPTAPLAATTNPYLAPPPPAAAPPPPMPPALPPAAAYPNAPYGYPAQRFPVKYLPYREGMATPPGYLVDTRVRKGFVIAGATTMGSLWLFSMTGAAFADTNHAPLWAPVVGPFIAIGTANPSGMGTFALVADGIGQAAGTVMFAIGMMEKEKVWRHQHAHSLSISPIALGDGRYGIGLQGTL